MSDRERWEELEEFLFDCDGDEFTVYDIAAHFGVTTRSAGLMIQSYLRAQRKPESSALYTLKRSGRTRNAVWSIGDRQKDAHKIGNTLYDDMVTKVKRAYAPDLAHLAARNPKAAKYVEQKIEAVTIGALIVLQSAVDGYMGE